MNVSCKKASPQKSALRVGERTLSSRLLLGTARYPSPHVLQEAISRSKAAVVTVSLRREMAAPPVCTAPGDGGQRFWDILRTLPVHLLPNTAGCMSAEEAIETARMARELFATDWIKLEVIGDDESLVPDPFGLVQAARVLNDEGFTVFPYTTTDLVVADRLRDAGCRILMPWGAPIGTGRGIADPLALASLRARHRDIPLIVDAGLGCPSQAARAMELGCDGVLLNTAVATADDPASMAEAFALAIEAGRMAFEAGMMAPRDRPEPSTPTVGRAFRLGDEELFFSPSDEGSPP